MNHYDVTLGINGRPYGCHKFLVAADSPRQAETSAITYFKNHCRDGKNPRGIHVATKTIKVVKFLSPHLGPDGKRYSE